MKRNRLIAIFLFSLWLLATTSCSVINGLGATPEPTPLPVVTAFPGVIAEGMVVPAAFANLSFANRGTIASIEIEEGSLVEPGAILIQLGDRENLQAALDAAQLAALTAQQQLDELNRLAAIEQSAASRTLAEADLALSEARLTLDDFTSQKYQDELDDQRDAIQDAKVELADRQEKLDTYADLDRDNATRKNAQQRVDDATRKLHEAELKYDRLLSQRDQAQAAYDLAIAHQEEATYQLDIRQEGTGAEQLARAQAALVSAESQLAAARATLAQMDLLAPYAGTIMEIHDLEAGEIVNPGQVLITFADVSTWYVETTDLTELDVARLEIGQEVGLIVDAFPERDLTGTLESISSTYRERSGDVLYTARIRIEDPPGALRWGMTVELTFAE